MGLLGFGKIPNAGLDENVDPDPSWPSKRRVLEIFATVSAMGGSTSSPPSSCFLKRETDTTTLLLPLSLRIKNSRRPFDDFGRLGRDFPLRRDLSRGVFRTGFRKHRFRPLGRSDVRDQVDRPFDRSLRL